jgi:hypothetical protein
MEVESVRAREVVETPLEYRTMLNKMKGKEKRILEFKDTGKNEFFLEKGELFFARADALGRESPFIVCNLSVAYVLDIVGMDWRNLQGNSVTSYVSTRVIRPNADRHDYVFKVASRLTVA